MPRPGRPAKLTPELCAAIVEDVERGHTLESASRRAGVHRVTLWRRAKAREKEGSDADARAFCQDLGRARVWALQKLSGPVLEDRNGTLVLVLTRRHRNGTLEVDERFIRPGSRQAAKLLARRDLASVAARSGLTLAEVRKRATGRSGRAAAALLREGDPVLTDLLGCVVPRGIGVLTDAGW